MFFVLLLCYFVDTLCLFHPTLFFITKQTNKQLKSEGVGKSSLISTFVSRHFSEVVPGIMTRVRLPPDPENSCITTIVDSQGGDAALMSAVATMSVTRGGVSGGGSSSIGTPGSTGVGGLVIEGTGGGAGALLGSPSSTSAAAAAGGVGTTTAGTTSGGSGETIPSFRSFSAAHGGMGGIENVDSIILIYDLDRDETFFRLENHWLPLIERCYNGGVSIYSIKSALFFFVFCFSSCSCGNDL
jgi:Ras family protein T1